MDSAFPAKYMEDLRKQAAHYWALSRVGRPRSKFKPRLRRKYAKR